MKPDYSRLVERNKSLKQREAVRKSMLGENNPMFGREPWNKGLKGRQPWMDISGLSPSPQTQFKKGSAGFNRKHSEDTKRKISMLQQGVDSVEDWGGYTTEEDKRARHEFRVSYQKKVFERDDYTCQKCGQHGGYLQVDHIKSWKGYPELRFDLGNCRTLCMACHYYVTFKRKLPKGVIWGHNFSKRVAP